MRTIILFAAAALALSVLSDTASAQRPGRIGGFSVGGATDNPVGPTVSPYLNLLQSNQGVTNYQSLVRPLIENRSAIASQGNSIQQLQQQVYSQPTRSTGGMRGTGHRTFFMNTTHYFPR